MKLCCILGMYTVCSEWNGDRMMQNRSDACMGSVVQQRESGENEGGRKKIERMVVVRW